MKPQGRHGMLPQGSGEQASLEACIASMRKFFTAELIPGAKTLYDQVLAPRYVRAHGHAPCGADTVGAMMNTTFYYRAASLLGRATQELLWDVVGEGVEAQWDELIDRAKSHGNPIGSVTLDPKMPMPAYIEAVDIHLMPGNFHSERRPDDVLAAALYDRGAYVFAYGGRGAFGENLGRIVAQMIQARFPDFKPRRILDMGCGVGGGTVALKAAWPNAEVHGCDVSAPMVRYAHARAESLGVAINFSQQDATRTQFPDGFFDLTVSMLVNHEMPEDVSRALLRESYRLLAPGGITLHDGRLNADHQAQTPYQQFMGGWFARNINEVYGQGLDAERDYQAAGFALVDLFSGMPEGDDYLKGQLSGHNYVGAIKASGQEADDHVR